MWSFTIWNDFFYSNIDNTKFKNVLSNFWWWQFPIKLLFLTRINFKRMHYIIFAVFVLVRLAHLLKIVSLHNLSIFFVVCVYFPYHVFVREIYTPGSYLLVVSECVHLLLLLCMFHYGYFIFFFVCVYFHAWITFFSLGTWFPWLLLQF